MGGCPCLPHSSAISELMKRAKSLISRSGFQPLTVQWRSRPIRIDRGCSAVRAMRLGYASRSFRALTGGSPGHDPAPWSPSQAVLTDRRRNQTPLRRCAQVLQDASLKSEFAARGKSFCKGQRWCCNSPHVPPSAAASALFSLGADAWLPRPRAAQPNLNPPDTTPIPTERKASIKTAFGYAQITLTWSLATATGTGAQNSGLHPPVSSTAVSTAMRGRR